MYVSSHARGVFYVLLCKTEERCSERGVPQVLTLPHGCSTNSRVPKNHRGPLGRTGLIKAIQLGYQRIEGQILPIYFLLR